MESLVFGLKREVEQVIEIKKSKFLGFSFIVNTVVDVQNILSLFKKKYSDATHICYAYKLLTGEAKYDDNGEPQGTAGKPILDCIIKKNITNVLIIVVRYFGGIKLGAGGLTRAYSNICSQVLDASEIKQYSLFVKISIKVSVKNNNGIGLIKRDVNFYKTNTIYDGSMAVIDTNVHSSFLPNLSNYLYQIFNENIPYEILGNVYL